MKFSLLLIEKQSWVVPKIFGGFPGGSVVKNPAANVGQANLIPGSGRSPEEGNGNPLQYSSLGNPMDRRAWWATVYGVAELDTNETSRNNSKDIWEII